MKPAGSGPRGVPIRLTFLSHRVAAALRGGAALIRGGGGMVGGRGEVGELVFAARGMMT